jgi:hypothetical protein
MVASFADMHYAALRPEDAVDPCRDHPMNLPDDDRGKIRLTHA